MKLVFSKISATGNDFIILDNRDPCVWGRGGENLSREQVRSLCTRRTGIGADGVILLDDPQGSYDFQMTYLNSDGNEVEMCGNGTRAISWFYHQVKKKEGEGHYTFQTQNALYSSLVTGNFVKVCMGEIFDEGALEIGDLLPSHWGYYINTGVPHCVYEVEGLDHWDVVSHGRRIRQNQRFERGANCNFFQCCGDEIKVRTYERGVEGETLACGTGVVAVALALYHRGDQREVYGFRTSGGLISVELPSPREPCLCGEVKKIYSGECVLDDL